MKKDKPNIRVLIVEDVALIAEDICDCLETNGYEVIGLAHSFNECKAFLLEETPDIALLDINLGANFDGLKIAKLIKEKYQFPFIFLTAYANKSILEEAKQLRPMGYIVKPFDEKDLAPAIEVALFNYAQLYQRVDLTQAAINKKLLANISKSEFETLKYIFQGKTNKQIAAQNHVSINTVKTHLRNIYSKLNVSTRTEAISAINKLLAAN